jgi:hypothetical protein
MVNMHRKCNSCLLFHNLKFIDSQIKAGWWYALNAWAFVLEISESALDNGNMAAVLFRMIVEIKSINLSHDNRCGWIENSLIGFVILVMHDTRKN